MKHYLNVYKRLLIINFSMLTAYRGNFINYLISGTVWGIFSFVSILLITSRVNEVMGWQRYEILVLTAVNQVIIGIFHMLFSSNFERFPGYIEQGRLDSYLLKPIDAQVLVSVWLIRIVSSSRVILGFVFLWYLSEIYNFTITFTHLLGFLPIAFLGLMIMYSLWFGIVTLCIWFTRLTNLPEVLYSLNGVSRYPPEIYRELSFIVFLFVFPITLIGVTPTRQLLGQMSLPGLIIPVCFAIVLFVGSRQLWKFALRSYTSASS